MVGRTATSLLPAAVALLFLGVGPVVSGAAEPRLGVTAANMPPQATMKRALTTASDDACIHETNDCAAEEACFTCLQVFVATVDGCAVAGDLSCSEAQETTCCTVAQEEEDCENNDLFGSFGT